MQGAVAAFKGTETARGNGFSPIACDRAHSLHRRRGDSGMFSASRHRRNAAVTRMTARDFPPALLELYDGYVHGRMSRRQFLDRAGMLALGGMTAVGALAALTPNYAWAQQVKFTDPDIVAEYIHYPSPNGHGQVRGYRVRPAKATGKLPGVVVRSCCAIVDIGRSQMPGTEWSHRASTKRTSDYAWSTPAVSNTWTSALSLSTSTNGSCALLPLLCTQCSTARASCDSGMDRCAGLWLLRSAERATRLPGSALSCAVTIGTGEAAPSVCAKLP